MARRWTFSKQSISLRRYGYHAWTLYSRCGRINDLYSNLKVAISGLQKCLLTNPTTLIAFFAASLHCFENFNFPFPCFLLFLFSFPFLLFPFFLSPFALSVLPLKVGYLKSSLGLEERCELPQCGLGRSPSRNRILCILALNMIYGGNHFNFFSSELTD